MTSLMLTVVKRQKYLEPRLNAVSRRLSITIYLRAAKLSDVNNKGNVRLKCTLANG